MIDNFPKRIDMDRYIFDFLNSKKDNLLECLGTTIIQSNNSITISLIDILDFCTFKNDFSIKLSISKGGRILNG